MRRPSRALRRPPSLSARPTATASAGRETGAGPGGSRRARRRAESPRRSSAISTTREFTKRSTELGSEVAQADREIDQRLHQVFDHHVSNLELMPGEAAAPPVVVTPVELTEQSLLDIPATFATGLTDLLADPDSVRQAIVLNEILHRPLEHW